jgi:RNA polymerase sigma-70 factor, ECF subfamily
MDQGLLRETVRSAASGDEGAAGALFDHFYPRVFRYAASRLRDRTRAEDVAAETFARILRDLHRFKWRGAGFEAWLFRIASNLVVDQIRTSGRERSSDDVLERTQGVQERSPEGTVLAGETTRELNRMLADLPPDQQEVLTLRFAGGLAPEEIGSVMGRKANAVRQLQFRALGNLRDKMSARVMDE